MSVKTELKKIAAKFKEQAERAKKDGVGVPPGPYSGRLDTGEIYSTSGGLRMKLGFTCVDSGAECEGQSIGLNNSMDQNPDSMYYTCLDISRLGGDIDAFTEDPEAVLAEIVARHPVMALTVSEKGGYTNTRIGAMLEESSEAPAEETEETEEEGGTLDVGSRITFTFKGEADAGEVSEIVDENTIKVRRDSNNRVATIKVEANNVAFEVAADAETEEEEPEAEVEETEEEEAPAGVPIAEGMLVEFPWKGVTERGTITVVLNDEQVKVKKDSDGKIATVKIENLTALVQDGTDAETEEEEEDEEAAPAPPPTPKPKPAAAAAKPGPKPGPKPVIKK